MLKEPFCFFSDKTSRDESDRKHGDRETLSCAALSMDRKREAIISTIDSRYPDLRAPRDKPKQTFLTTRYATLSSLLIVGYIAFGADKTCRFDRALKSGYPVYRIPQYHTRYVRYHMIYIIVCTISHTSPRRIGAANAHPDTCYLRTDGGMGSIFGHHIRDWRGSPTGAEVCTSPPSSESLYTFIIPVQQYSSSEAFY